MRSAVTRILIVCVVGVMCGGAQKCFSIAASREEWAEVVCSFVPAVRVAILLHCIGIGIGIGTDTRSESIQ